jgi:hypothetical protein
MIQPGIYRIKNAKSGTYLDASKKNQGKVHGWSSRPNNENQQWRVEESGGAFTFKNVELGTYLHVSGVHDGSNVKASNSPTRWNLDQDGNSWLILAENSEHTVDLDMGRDDDGTSINLWRRSGAQQQKWKLERVGDLGGGGGGYHQAGQQQAYAGNTNQSRSQGSYTSNVLPPGAYFIRNVHTGTALDLSGSSPQDGTRVIGYQVTSGPNQQWVLEPGNNGYRLRNSASGTYAGFQQHEQAQDGTLLSGNRNPVEWTLTKADQGYQIHYAGNQNLVLDLASGDASDGAKVCLWSNKGGNNQKWNLTGAY